MASALAGCALALALGILGIAWQSQRATAEARAAQRSLYGADMLLVQQALQESDLGRAKKLLDRHRPASKSETDLRGWEWRYLWSQCQSDEQSTLFRRRLAVTALAFSSDGTQLAMHEEPDTVMLWDARSRRMISEHPASPWFKALAASPTNQLFAWGTRESDGAPSVVLWDIASQREVARLPHTNDVVSLAFSGDAQWLATLTRRSEVAVWNVASRQVAVSFQLRTNVSPLWVTEYGCVLFATGDRLLAVGTWRGDEKNEAQLRLLDWTNGVVKGIPLSKPADGVTAMAFTPDGKWLALGGGYRDHRVHLHELATGKWRYLEAERGWIESVAFSPDGEVLASANSDQTIRLWDWRRGIQLKRFQGHENGVCFVAWTPDGQRLVSGSEDGSVRYWDQAAEPHELGYAAITERTSDVAFGPHSDRLATLNWAEKTVVVRDVHTLQEIRRISEPGKFWPRLALAGDGRWLAVGDQKGNVVVWDYESGLRVTNFVVGNRWIQYLEFASMGDSLLCLGESADGQGVLQLHETATWGAVDLHGINLHELYRAALSPNGRTLAVARRDGTVTWWDLRTKQRQALFHWRHLGPEIEMAFSPDGRWFAAGGARCVLMIVEVANKRTVEITRAHRGLINALTFSPDGRRLITAGTAGGDGVRVWDVENRRDIARLSGKGNFINHVGFSPDGNTLYAVQGEGIVMLWHAPSFEEIAGMEQPEAHSR